MAKERVKILINAASNAVNYAVTVVVVFYMSPILVHGLGDDRYGVWLLVESVLAYLAMADLGVGAAVLRYVARFESLRDEENLNRVFNTSLCIFLCAGLFVFVCTTALALSQSRPLGVPMELADGTRWLLILLGANLGLGLPLSIFKMVLLGLARYPAVNLIRISSLLLRNGLLLAAIHEDGELRGVGLAITVSGLVDALWTALMVRHYLPSLRFSSRYVCRSTLREIWSYSANVFVGKIAWLLTFQSRPLVIGGFLKAGAITYFGIGTALVDRATDGLLQLAAVLTPAVSKWDARGDHGAIRDLLLGGTRYILYLAIPLEIALLVFGYDFVSLWMGQEYAELCFATMTILSIPLLLVVSHSIGARILEGIGKVRVLAILNVVQSILNVVLSVLLVKPFGIAGVAVGTAIPLTLHCLLVTFVVCHHLHIRLSILFVRSFVAPLLVSMVPCAVWIMLQFFWSVPGWPPLICRGLIGLVPYAVIVVLAEPGLRNTAVRLLADTWHSIWRRRSGMSVDCIIAVEEQQV